MIRSRLFPLLALVLVLPACNNDDNNAGPCGFNINENTVFYEFQHQGSGDTFIAWTDDPDVIANVEAQLALPEAQRNQHINGEIARWPADCGALWEWTWYFVGNEWDLADISIEVCDGDPNYVSANLEEFIDDTNGRYCPWSSYVLREVPSPF